MPEQRQPSLNTSHFSLFGDFKSVVDLNTQVPYGGLQLVTSEQQLHNSEVFVRL